jgi:hypothetical protein
MFTKIAAAAIAATLIASSAFAQGTNPTRTSAKPTITTGVKVKQTGAITKPAHQQVMVKKHRHVVHVKHLKRAKHIAHVKHLKQAKSKRAA